MIPRIASGCIATLLLTFATLAQAQDLPLWPTGSYVFQTVDVPSPGTDWHPPGTFGVTMLADLSDLGTPVGNILGSLRAFTFEPVLSTVADIVCPQAGVRTEVTGINHWHQVVANCMGPDRTTGMLAGPWLAQPVIIDVPGSLNTYVYSANWQHVAGTYEDANGASHGFIGMPNALATFDAPVPGLFNTWTYALNNAGAHVGLYETENLYAGYLAYQQHFWRFVVPGSTFTVPLDINDHWEIVGLYTMGGIVKSFVWSEGIFYEFRAPGWPEVETLVHSFNTPGQFAGYVITDADTFTARGFLATRLPETPGAAMMAKTARTQTAQPQRMASARSTLCQANGQRYSSKLQAVMTQLCR